MIQETETYLAFNLGKESFAVNVKNVLEVLRNRNLTPVPRTQDYINGIINFRGDIVTVVDTHKKLGLSQPDSMKAKAIIVFELELGEQNVLIGATANSVKDVIEINPAEIKPVPDFGAYFNPEYLKGAIHYKEKFVVILDIEQIFSENEIQLLKETPKS